MMKNTFLIIALLICTPILSQVNNEVDSLLKLLDTQSQDSSKSHILSRIGNYYIDNNPNKAITYFEQAAVISKKLNSELQLANNYYNLGFCYILKGDFDKSLAYYQQSSKIYEKLKDKRRLANSFMSIGKVYFQNKAVDKANGYLDKAEAIVRETKDSFQLVSIYSERGIRYDQAAQYDLAIVYHQKAIDMANLINDAEYATFSLSNMGLTYKHKKNTTLALKYFDKVLNRYKAIPDEAKDLLASIYNNIAATHAQAGNYPKAIEGFNKSIDYAVQGDLAAIEMENYHNIADMYADMKDYRRQSIYLQKYYNLKDSLFSSDNKNQLTQLETDYQLEKKNISLVKQAAETNKQKNQRNIFIIIAIAAALLLVALAFFYQRIKQNNVLLHEKNSQINKQKNELQTLNHVKDRLFSVISHDLRNPLVTLKTYLTLADSPTLSAEKKEGFKKQTLQAVSQTGNMLDNLLVWANMQIKNTKPAITNINLEDCMDDAIAAAKAQATHKRIQITKNIAVTNTAADHNILEIALRNIITNAIKYSYEDRLILISSYYKNGQTCISIKDEGVGMTIAQIEELINNDIESTAGTQGEKGSGLGLFLVKELLQKINAILKIESEVGKGSNFIIEFAV